MIRKIYYIVCPADIDFLQEETSTLNGALEFSEFFLKKGVSSSIYKRIRYDGITIELNKVGQFNAK